MSQDGSRIVFTDNADGQIYLRDGDRTVHVSASQRRDPDPNGQQPAQFLTATPDLSRIFFRSGEKLTDDATTGPASTGSDLYRYDVSSETLTDLSVDTLSTEGDGASVQGVVGVSDDGEVVYFGATGDRLVAEARDASPSLYVSDHGTVRLVASLGFNDGVNWDPTLNSRQRAVTVTPDGGYALFTSREQLTGFLSGGSQEIYRYSLADRQFACVSCGADGTSATGDARLNEVVYTFPGSQNLTRNLFPDGTVLFTTPEALVGRDTNGQNDVYQWSPQTGHLLISSGRGASGSSFVDASADRGSIFFVTRDRLVGRDPDGLQDMYVARTDGGFAEPPAAGVPCSGDACQGPQPPRPPESVPPSVTFSGPGNADIHEVQGTPVFHVGAITGRQRQILARRGVVALRVAVSEGGKITASAHARIGRGVRRVARQSRTVTNGGLVTLRLRLSPTARRAFRRTHTLPLTFIVSYSRVHGSQRSRLTLRERSTVRRQSSARRRAASAASDRAGDRR
jgi:hypothetical protein